MNPFLTFGRSVRSTFAALACALALSPVAASAQQVLLTVDIADPSTPVFAGTGEFSLADATISGRIGVTLDELFTTDFLRAANILSGDLAVAGSPVELADNNSGPTSETDLNLRQFFTTSSYDFTTTTPAFTGSATVPSGTFGSIVPYQPVGTIGDIFLGDESANPGLVLGQFEVIDSSVIPEPTAALGVTLLGLAALRRRRAS
jgi:MYXO-CTERM domain-containing protein